MIINVENDGMLGRTNDKTLHISLIEQQKEIDRLKEENNILCSIANGEKEKEDKILELVNRINKAIEMLDSYEIFMLPNNLILHGNLLCEHLEKIYKVLKGDDKE